MMWPCNPPRHLSLGLSVLGIHLFFGVIAVAQESGVDAQEAFSTLGNPSWYDKENGGYAPPNPKSVSDNPLRQEGWVNEGGNEANRTRKPATPAGRTGPRWTGAGADIFSAVILGMLAVSLLAVILLLTYYSLRNYMPTRWGEQSKRPAKIEIDPAKVSELPFEVKAASYTNPLAEAEALMRSGRYDQAIVFLYGYMLLALDQSRRIELQKGKTNRMYLREIHNSNRLRAILEAVMLSFEDVYFGKHPITAARFMESWNQLDEFHRLLAAVPHAAQVPQQNSQVATV